MESERFKTQEKTTFWYYKIKSFSELNNLWSLNFWTSFGIVISKPDFDRCWTSLLATPVLKKLYTDKCLFLYQSKYHI